MIPFVYGSGAIGLLLFGLIIKREINKVRLRLQGYEKLKIPEFGSRSHIYRHRDTVLFDIVAKNYETLKEFIARPDDTWVVSFPRSGTTWVQEIIYLIQTNLDLDSAKLSSLDTRFPYLEFEYPGLKEIEKNPSPRFIKSHLPYHLLPPSLHESKAKVIYISRNPRDVMTSYFYYARMLQPLNFVSDFQTFSDLFLKNLVPYAPWWKHVLDFWQHRQDDNVLFLTYEQLHKETRNTIKKIASFLGKSLTDEDIEKIIDHCSFENMKKNPSVNYSWFDTLGVRRQDEGEFMRAGKIGDWQSHFTPALNIRVEQMINYRLKDSELFFDYYPAAMSEDSHKD